MIVVDASAMIELLLGTVVGQRVRSRIEEERCCVPHLLDVEVVQVLRRFVRARMVDPERARVAVEDLRDFPLLRQPHLPLLQRALQLRDNLSAYDAVYLALAEAHGAKLVTCDRKLSKAPSARALVDLVA